MNRMSVISLILAVMLGGSTGGCSNGKSAVESKAKEAVESVEEKMVGAAKKLEKNYRTLEAEKDYDTALEAEPKAPPESLGADRAGADTEGELLSPPE